MPYFDAASSLPPHPVAREALLAALDDGWADPGRLHRAGRRARMLLDAARETAAEAVGCRPDELTFTSSGTRALHTGIVGALAGRARAGRHLLVSAVEHSAVLHAADVHRNAGGTVAEIGVDRAGRVAPDDVAAALAAGPGPAALVCVQSANHEVGTRQPVVEIAEVCRAAGVPLLVDAAQSLPWEPVGGDWSVLTGSAHKWGGPGGVGLLVVRKGVRFAPPGPVDERESGRAPGFENIPAIVAAAASLRAVRQEAAAEAARLRELVDRIRARVPELVPDVEVVGDQEHRLPGIVTFSCLYVDGEALLHALDRGGFAVSSGSSCTSSTLTPSHVLRAMGVLSEGNVRVSLPPGTPAEEVERFLAVLPGTVAAVRDQLSPPPPVTVPAADGDALTVDSLGKLCPVPVIELARAIGQVRVGGVITVLSDDTAARLDIPAWCAMRGHEYLGESPVDVGPGTAYRVRRSA
ncbi:cysteine desulfurase/sulfurtransferase TusA family protein [Streptomyces litchfieldiae]|uniref:Aminotransferase class V-fold PLP-dependent enzyme n=1 Tax=Streptomyces litchfieldiae TaxID=3075543 RepID=A0ABU2MT10_9ACTN|nr:aminotransferase class V-fold PLP-dependent enzyme [Streptomyces sp. DSM 44938]MDT0344670.1 aminotransferase class V-fold PLP-dependent enzyme [Streptomyces sp. DSM 44938]